MNIEGKKEIVRNYLKENPNATCKQIKKDTKLKLENQEIIIINHKYLNHLHEII